MPTQDLFRLVPVGEAGFAGPATACRLGLGVGDPGFESVAAGLQGLQQGRACFRFALVGQVKLDVKRDRSGIAQLLQELEITRLSNITLAEGNPPTCFFDVLNIGNFEMGF